MDLLNDWCFTSSQPREPQVRILNEIGDALDNFYNNIVVEAGTGIGKSSIATTVANHFSYYVKGSYILTRTKQLQEQYMRDFGMILCEIKGRNNYVCNIESTRDFTFTCDTCTKTKPCPYTRCSYRTATHLARKSHTVLANYDYMYYSNLASDIWDTRKLVVLDEAHKFESFIMNKVTRSFSDSYCKKHYGIDIFYDIRNGGKLSDWTDPFEWIPVVERIIGKLSEMLSDYKQQFDAMADTRSNRKKKAWLGKKIHQIPITKKSYDGLIDELFKGEEWVVLLPTKSQILNGKYDCKVEFKPITAEKYTDTILNLGHNRLFMTATIGDEDKFCEWIGIDKDNTYFIHEKGNFPVENRPIYKDYVGNFKGSHKDSNGWTIPNWKTQSGLDKILEISRKYPNQKGIIHTTSHQQTYWILQNLSNKLPLWKIEADKKQNYNNLTREQIVDKFINTDDSAILVGAGIKDGVDFKDDACRFQILYKTPYPAFDAQVRKRNRKDKVWWNYQAAMDSMQSYGRGVRSETDYCDFYILDSEFENLLNRYNNLFNEYFLEAIQ